MSQKNIVARWIDQLEMAELNRMAPMIFLWIAAPALIVIAILAGPFEGGEEPAHFYRTVALANGEILPEKSPPAAPKQAAGAYLDVATVDLVTKSIATMGTGHHRYSLEELRQKGAAHEGREKVFAPHSNTAIYPPFLYVVPTVAVFLAKSLGLPVLLWLYAARLANVLFALLVIHVSLRKAQDEKLVLFVGALLPVTLFQIATLSADSLLFPLIIAFCVMLLRVQRGGQSTAKSVALAATTIVIGAGKVAYMPLIGLPPLAAYLAGRRWTRQVSFFVGIGILSVLAWAAWAWCVSGYIFSIRPNIEIDPNAQLKALLVDPFASAWFFLHSMAVLTPKLVIGAVGRWLGWEVLTLPSWLIYALPFLLVAAAVPSSEQPQRRRPWLTWAAVLVGIVCYAAIFLLIYLQYNAVGAREIAGVSGRYFTPLAFLVLSLTPRLQVSPACMRPIWLAATLLGITCAAVTVGSVADHYW